jgi:hypothetical protein
MKTLKPTHFGKRPILMLRACGGLRIIYPDGKVEFTYEMDDTQAVFRYGCTSSTSQKKAFNECVAYDRRIRGRSAKGYGSHSAFLGYL